MDKSQYVAVEAQPGERLRLVPEGDLELLMKQAANGNFLGLPASEVTLGARVRMLRAFRGLSREELARAADLEPRQIARIERDEVKSPHQSTLRALGKALGGVIL